MAKLEFRRNLKEVLIVSFVLVCALMALVDIGKNLADENSRASELKTLTTEPPDLSPEIESTLSDEEMKRWSERLEKHPDT